MEQVQADKFDTMKIFLVTVSFKVKNNSLIYPALVGAK